MLVNREAELMHLQPLEALGGLGSLACAGCFDTCLPSLPSKAGLGNAPNDYACSLDSLCSGMMDGWCYSLGAGTSRCISWRQGLFGPPMPTAPAVPLLNPDGRTSASVEDIIAATAARQAESVKSVFSEQADSMDPAGVSTDYMGWIIVGGLVVGVVILKNLIR